MDLSKLHVVTVISNPIRYKSRYDLFKKFERHMIESGAQLHVVELATGDRPHVITDAQNHRHYRLRSGEVLWHKENMINIAVQRLPQDWKYVAWIDADVFFLRQDWLLETVHQLQLHPVVQLFSHAQDVSPHMEPIQTHKGFVYMYHLNHMQKPNRAGHGGLGGGPYEHWHPGYAWACTRDAWNHLGGLIDFTIGAADHHMAMALINDVQRSYPQTATHNYKHLLDEWQLKADLYIKNNLGYVPGLINHLWHGKKKNRFYVERWDIITKNKYDPVTDIKKDWQGLWQLNTDSLRQRTIKHQIIQYFKSRDEDSIDVT